MVKGEEIITRSSENESSEGSIIILLVVGVVETMIIEMMYREQEAKGCHWAAEFLELHLLSRMGCNKNKNSKMHNHLQSVD